MSAIQGRESAAIETVQAEPLPDRRSSPRFAVLSQTAKLVGDDQECLCVIRNASVDGVKVCHFGFLPEGKSFEFELSNGEVFPVKVVWRDDESAGLEFPSEVDLERLARMNNDADSRQHLRFDTALDGAVANDSGRHKASIRNISQQGVCIDCGDQLEKGSELTIEIDGAQPIRANVRWHMSKIYGLMFDELLDLDQLAANVASNRR
jgi:hypothetical protein